MNISKSLFNKIVLYAVIFFLALLAPSQLNAPSQATIRAICTGLAIDASQEIDNGVSVTAQVLIPQPGGQYSQSMSLVTSDGLDLLEAFNKMEFQIGKKIRLEHCCFIIIGMKASEQNLTRTLDYLIRGNNSGNNTVLVQTKGEAKDLIAVSSNVNSNEIDNIQTIVRYNEQYLTSNEANLKSFFSDYHSPHRTSIMSCIETYKEDSTHDSGGHSESASNGGEQSSGSGESGGQSGSGGATSKLDKIKNDGSVAVYLDGKLAKIVSGEERKYFNWLDGNLRDNYVKIENVNDKVFQNATIGYTILDKSLNPSFKMVNNTPCIFLDINLKLRTEMILEQDGTSLPYRSYISDAVVKAFNTLVEEEVQKAMEIQREYGFDVFNYYKEFNTNMTAQWQQYLNSLDTPQDYIKGIEVFTKVTCDSLV